MAAGLFYNSFTGIYQYQSGCSRRGSRYHVSGILHVARRIGHNKLAFGRGKVAISYINGNALLTLGPQAVC